MEKANDRPLVQLHWALVVSLIYLIVLGHPSVRVPVFHLLYVAVLLGGSVMILRLPFASSEAFGATLVAFDTLSALLGLALNPSTSQNFLIGYFLCIVMASLGDSQGRLVGAALLVAGTYAIWMLQGHEAFQTSPVLLRLPFLFVATVFYGVVMQRVRGEHQYREVFQASPRPIWVYDERTLRFLAVNDAAVRGYGYSRNEFLALTLKDIRPEEELPKLLESLSRMSSRLTVAGEFRHRKKDGTMIDVDVVSQPIRFGGRNARLVIVTDITASKHAQDALKEALRKSEQSDQLKSSFLANMSHEIRTPLNVILGYNEIIRETVAKRDPSLAVMLDSIQRASERLLGTIRGVLDLAKLRSGVLDCRPMPLDLTRVIAEHLRWFEPRARGKGLSLSSSMEVVGAVVLFDEYCLSTALHNVLDNAVKFTTDGAISLRLLRGDRDELIVEIRDTGVGIAWTHLPRLFEAFTQEDNGDARSFEGAGIGLAVAKGLLELNGAELSIHSDKGKGTKVRIRFDAQTELRPSLEADADGAADLAERKPIVVLVEDDSSCQLYVEAVLGRSYRIVSTSTAQGLREALAGHGGEIRAVLMDVTLAGGEDGLSLTRFLRSQPGWRKVPVVATTAHDLPESRLEAFEAGCNAFLRKPFTPRQLLDVVDGFASIPQDIHPS